MNSVKEMSEQFSVDKEFGDDIRDIWKNTKFGKDSNKLLLERGFAVQDNIDKKAVMFIGINPSFTNKAGQSENCFYPKPKTPTLQYFQMFIDISKEINEELQMEWTHWDLLFFRESPQDKVKDICDFNKEKDYINKVSGRDFILKQLEVSRQVIEKAQPKVIVVCNSYARDLIKPHDNGLHQGMFKFKWDDEIGTYRIVNNDFIEGTPVMFSSMISGQRALDIGSRERLVWHIKQILKDR